MSRVNLIEIGSATGVCSGLALSYFLRWGFIPAPLHLDSGMNLLNSYEDFSPDSNALESTRHLDEFSGSRAGYESDLDSAVRDFSSLLIEEVARSVGAEKEIFVMASGGKDSLSIAWALKELGVSATLVHCRDYIRDDESSATSRAAEQLGHRYIEISTTMAAVDRILHSRIGKMPIPIADVAFFPYLAAIDEIDKIFDRSEGGARRVVVLDGMGNDAYMGHIPGVREKRLLKMPRVPVSEALASYFYGNNVIHYGLEMLERNKYERHFSGVGFSIDGLRHENLSQIFERFSSMPEYRRALIRGAVFDPDCCMRKGVLAGATSKYVEVDFPYFSSRMRDFFNAFSCSVKFDYPKSINKLILREHLKRVGINSEFASSKKGSFRCDLSELPDVYIPSRSIKDLVCQVGLHEKFVDRLHANAGNNFVASQKLVMLYILEKYCVARGGLSELNWNSDRVAPNFLVDFYK